MYRVLGVGYEIVFRFKKKRKLDVFIWFYFVFESIF